MLLLLALAACGEDLPPTIDAAAMDRSADPCSDFYQYACGGFLAAHPVGGDGAVWPRSAQAFFATEDAERRLVEQTSGLIHDYYAGCLRAGDRLDRLPLQQLFHDIDVMPLSAVLAELHAAGVDALFGFGSTRDLMYPVSVIAAMWEGGIGLPDRDYYFEPFSTLVVPAYRSHIQTLMTIVGDGAVDAAVPDAVIAVETALAAAMLEIDARRDPLAVYHMQTLSQVRDSLPHLDLDGYLRAAAAPAFSSLDVTVPAFVQALDQVLATTDPADLKRYLKFRTVEGLASSLGDDVVAEEYNFHDGVFYGFTQPLPRDEYCLRLTVDALPWNMSEAYVATLPAERRQRAATMVERIRQSLRSTVENERWLDEPTRRAALDKLEALRAEVFAPEDFAAYEPALTNLASNFQLAVLTLQRELRRRSLARIGTDDAAPWFMSPVRVNAAYSPTLNAINLPAAILQRPFFDEDFDDAANFGALGTLVGHELTHGFDDQGRRFDGAGALVDWWSDATDAAFVARAECVADGYGSVEAAPGVRVDGRLTLGENIADLGGMRLSYAALAPSKEVHGGYSEEQRYFIAYAQAWCTSIRPQALLTQLQTDPHSPSKVRVNQVLAYTPQFAAAFSCAAGSPLAPAARCEVW